MGVGTLKEKAWLRIQRAGAALGFTEGMEGMGESENWRLIREFCSIGIPWRYCGFDSRPPQSKEYHNKAHHMNLLVSQCI